MLGITTILGGPAEEAAEPSDGETAAATAPEVPAGCLAKSSCKQHAARPSSSHAFGGGIGASGNAPAVELDEEAVGEEGCETAPTAAARFGSTCTSCNN